MLRKVLEKSINFSDCSPTSFWLVRHPGFAVSQANISRLKLLFSHFSEHLLSVWTASLTSIAFKIKLFSHLLGAERTLRLKQTPSCWRWTMWWQKGMIGPDLPSDWLSHVLSAVSPRVVEKPSDERGTVGTARSSSPWLQGRTGRRRHRQGCRQRWRHRETQREMTL